MHITQFRWCERTNVQPFTNAHKASLVRVSSHMQRHYSSHGRDQSRDSVITASGGLFGGLQKMFQGQSNDDKQQQPAKQSAPAVPASKVMFPPYTIVKKGEVYDIRLYEVYPVVQMSYQQRAEGYVALGAYIDGDNASSTKFCYSQPVVMKYLPSGQKLMQMYVGAPRGQQASAALPVSELPAPSDGQVQLGVSGGELVAVHKFEGYITPQAAAAARQKLVDALQKDGVSLADEEAEGLFRVGQYGAVYQLEARLNEMLLRIKV